MNDINDKKIDIVVTAYNSSRHIAKLLLSIKQQDYNQYNCFVIDDASRDSTTEIVREKFPWAKLIIKKENQGPAKNRNTAIGLGTAPYIVFLDSDAFLSDTSWLSKALKIMENDQNIGQVASMIVSGYDDDILLDCGIGEEGSYFGGIYYKKNKNNIFGKHQISRKVLGACSAGTILRRDVFEKIKGFDHKYYSAEDLDLSIRIHLLGYNVVYEPSLVVHHFESHTMGERVKFKNYSYLYYRNSLLILAENYPLKYALKKIFIFFGQAIFFSLYYLVARMGLMKKRYSFEIIKIHFKSLIFIALNAPAIVMKRWKINQYKKRSRKYLIDIGKKLKKETNLVLPIKGLIYEITNKCNARCKMCFLYKEINKEADLLTLDEIRKTFQSFKELNNIVLGGGEPFLRDDIDKICELLINNNSNIAITISTNGSMPDIIYKKTKTILDYGINNLKISISLDGMTAYHDKNRGIIGLFDNVQKCYTKLSNLRKIYGNRLQIQINTCLSKENLDQLDALFNYIVVNMPESSWVFEPVRGSFNQEEVSSLSKSDWTDLQGKIDKFNNATPLASYNFLKKAYEYSIRILDEKTQALPCLAGEEFIAMDYAGNIRPCEILTPIKNIRAIDYDINRLSVDRKWINVCDSIRQKKCYCAHFCWLAYSLDKYIIG